MYRLCITWTEDIQVIYTWCSESTEHKVDCSRKIECTKTKSNHQQEIVSYTIKSGHSMPAYNFCRTVVVELGLRASLTSAINSDSATYLSSSICELRCTATCTESVAHFQSVIRLGALAAYMAQHIWRAIWKPDRTHSWAYSSAAIDSFHSLHLAVTSSLVWAHLIVPLFVWCHILTRRDISDLITAWSGTVVWRLKDSSVAWFVWIQKPPWEFQCRISATQMRKNRCRAIQVGRANQDWLFTCTTSQCTDTALCF